MFYIKEEYKNKIEIKKSEFIAVCLPIDDKLQLEKNLVLIKKSYPKASHYCYACIIDDFIKFSDDKEPINTAGRPILNVLQSKKLNHILLIVIRYFGGIKLGASNLLRAYVESCLKVLDKVQYYERKQLDKIQIIVPYKYSDTMFYMLEKENYLIINKIFAENILLEVAKENINIDLLINKFKAEIEVKFIGKEDIFIKIN